MTCEERAEEISDGHGRVDACDLSPDSRSLPREWLSSITEGHGPTKGVKDSQPGVIGNKGNPQNFFLTFYE